MKKPCSVSSVSLLLAVLTTIVMSKLIVQFQVVHALCDDDDGNNTSVWRFDTDDSASSAARHQPLPTSSTQRHTLLENVVIDLPLDEHTFADTWNPRNASSKWEWHSLPPDMTSDSAAFVLSPANKHNDQQRPRLVTMISLPFTKHYPPSIGPAAQAAGSAEAVINPKRGVSIGPMQKVLARLVFSCSTYNANQHHFPKRLVTDAGDDPRLGCCAFFLSDVLDTGINLVFMATSKAVWASYSRDPYTRSVRNRIDGPSWQAFDVWRRVARRKRSHDFIDLAILYDRARSEATYFVNDESVWKIGPIGRLPVLTRRDRVVLQTGGRDEPATPAAFSIAFGTYGPLDRYDPNNSSNNEEQQTALMRIAGGDTRFYGDMQFWDDFSSRANKTFGQGAALRLKRCQVSLSDSGPASSSDGLEEEAASQSEYGET